MDKVSRLKIQLAEKNWAYDMLTKQVEEVGHVAAERQQLMSENFLKVSANFAFCYCIIYSEEGEQVQLFLFLLLFKPPFP